jgi:excinuclease ABC subunit C
LAGSDTEPVDGLEEQMHAAVERTHFEQAARLRDDLHAVSWLARRLGDLAQARNDFTFIYPVEGSSKTVWYLIRRGVIEGSLLAPRTPYQLARAQRLVVQWLDEENTIGRRFPPRPETLATVSSWFRNNRPELKHTLRPEAFLMAQSSA